ncbi:transposase domain-containing protein [Bradyrhizobium sp. S69]|uniref:transposase domain-containing protein n=1 Tax=Bradyrhizobium sp. S69 TaxID=1641856 RepID=UPI001FF072B3|nr:transposase domain-containing protein [Bradyrhizobium sp. S69]
MTDVLTGIVNGHPNSDIDQLLPRPTDKQTFKPWPDTTLTIKLTRKNALFAVSDSGAEHWLFTDDQTN